MPDGLHAKAHNLLPGECKIQCSQTHYELGVHLSGHEDQTLAVLQLWVVVEDELAGSIFTHCLRGGGQSKEKLGMTAGSAGKV